jgi:DNA-binding response OmpR family regulator/S1-C subfamily serine protease
MEQRREKIIILENDASARARLTETLRAAGYDAVTVAALAEGLEVARQSADLLLLDAGACSPTAQEVIASVHGSEATDGVRVVLLVGPAAAERAAALDIGADDAISRPWDPGELVARLRTQLRVRRQERELRRKTRIAEEGQQIAHTAFEALAVTEKMANEATSLDRRLKIVVAAAFAAVAVMAGIYLLFVRSAQHQTKNMNAVIAQLNGSVINQQDLMARTRELRRQFDSTGSSMGKGELQQRAQDLKAQMATADSAEFATLRKELAETNARLRRMENDGSVEALIAHNLKSVCLLHVSVAFRQEASGRLLRYAGLDKQGEPIRDGDGKPVLTLEGNGPEVNADIFGSAFLVTRDGLVVTNHHVAQPWWKNDQLGNLTLQGFQPEISAIRAYFPGDPRAFRGEIVQISPDADLATIRVDMEDLRRDPLRIDPRKDAAVAGEPIVLMGYATGIAAILARADDATVQKITAESDGDVSQILSALARQDLIRPLITQGHIGDVSTDKIVFDAQTTSGGSGGPLLNDDGKVIGVTYAILRGFGGSNLGIPIRLAEPLLGH